MKRSFFACCVLSLLFLGGCAENDPVPPSNNNNNNGGDNQDGNSTGSGCTANKIRCVSGSSDEREICNSSSLKWEAYESCGSDEICQGGQCIFDDEGSSGGSCTAGATRCLSGSVRGREVCDDSGKWTRSNCDAGMKCQSGECKPDETDVPAKPDNPQIPNSCDKPWEVSLGTKLLGSTHTESNSYYSAFCKDYSDVNQSSSEGVFKLSLEDAGYYDIVVAPEDAEHGVSFYVRRECKDSISDYTGECFYDLSSSPISKKIYMPAGENYLFVESNDPEVFVDYDVTVTYDEESSNRFCGNKARTTDVISRHIDTSSGIKDHEDSTSRGAKEFMWGSSGTCNDLGTDNGGQEILYAFHVSKPLKVTARVTPIFPEDSADGAKIKTVVYIVSCVSAIGSTQACAGGTIQKGSAANYVQLIKKLEKPGVYYVVVDGVSNAPYKYKLDVSFKEE